MTHQVNAKKKNQRYARLIFCSSDLTSVHKLDTNTD